MKKIGVDISFKYKKCRDCGGMLLHHTSDPAYLVHYENSQQRYAKKATCTSCGTIWDLSEDNEEEK